MRIVCVMVIGIALLPAAPAAAETDIVGSYSGTVSRQDRHGNARQDGIELVIEAAANGAVKGKAKRFAGGPCSGEYPMAGTYSGNTLDLKSVAKSGSASDCGLSLRLTVEGNQLSGTTGGGRPVRFSR